MQNHNLPVTPTPEVSPEWKAQAYPLQQVTIKLQGTKSTTKEGFCWLLEQLKERIIAGDTSGTNHDDDFGYIFETALSEDTFFHEPCAVR